MRKPEKLAYLLIADGTRGDGKKAFLRFVERLQRAFPQRGVEPAFLKPSRPAVSQGIQACMERGAEEIFVLPFLSPAGRPMNQEIPLEIQAAKRRYPSVDFHYAGTLTLNPSDSPLSLKNLLHKGVAHG